MFGTYFYHERLRKAVSSFGALFNDLYVLRRNKDGHVVNTQKVPLSYGPRSKFLDRIREQADLTTDQKVAIKLPRMSFEITNISYDPTRQLPKTNNINKAVEGTVLNRNKLYAGVPYLVSFQLAIFSKQQDDALQIVEQIIPYFNPQYTLNVKPFSLYPDVIQDVPVTLTGVVLSDDYEGTVADTRRTIMYTLDFDMQIYFHGPFQNSGIIRKVDARVFDGNVGLGLGSDSDVPLEKISVTPSPSDIGPDSDFGFITAITGLDSAEG